MKQRNELSQEYLSGYLEGRKSRLLEKKELLIDESLGMKVISFGLGEWNVFDKNLKVSDKLPPLVFRVEFHPQRGFYLQEEPSIKVLEKIYGKYNQTVKLMIEGFEQSDRNMGIIFSGEKGLGKSLTAKYMCQEMLSKGYPVIVISQYIDGLNNFLRTIQQEVVIYLDEFDKIFRDNQNRNSNVIVSDSIEGDFRTQTVQDKLLSLFDGSSVGKKLFLLTCNNIFDLSNYLLNRTGRCHYYIRFDYPDSSDIEEYLKDKLKKVDYSEIDKVIEFANKVKLNYDALRSICFELSLGRRFEDVIEILNILNIDSRLFEIELEMNDNNVYKMNKSIILDREDSVYLEFKYAGFYVEISLRNLKYNGTSFYIENPEKEVVIKRYNSEGIQGSNNLVCKKCTLSYKSNTGFNYSLK